MPPLFIKYLEEIGAIGIFAIVYFLSAKFGLSLAFAHPSASAIWPPTGISLAALLFFGYRLWPGIFIGAFFANFTTEGTFFTSFGIAIGNTMEAVVGAYLINRFANGLAVFEHVQDVSKFLFFATVIGPLFSATIGVSSLALAGFVPFSNYELTWFTWWLGDAVSAIIIVPFLILWAQYYRLQWSWQKWLELSAFAAVFFAVMWALFTQSWIGDYGYPVFTIPLFVWVALRFSPRETTAAVLGMAVFSVWGTVEGIGLLAEQPIEKSILLLQLFMAVIAATSLLLSVVVLERGRVKDALEKADKAKDDFLASLSHELRNPLASMSGNLQLLQFGIAKPFEYRRAVDTIEHELRHVTRLLEDLLDLSRIRRGRMELQKVPVELKELVRMTAASIEHLMKKYNHAFTVEYDTEPMWIHADPSRIKQVLVNLLTNAARYTDKGGAITLVCRAVRGDAVLTVKDTGVGIEPEKLAHIFDMHGQPERVSHARAGLGIGLILSRRLVDAHGGTIRAESKGPGAGSTFTVTFPLLTRKDWPAQEFPPESPLLLPEPKAKIPKRHRVVVVDDNQRAADVLVELLRRLEHHAWVAYDGESALEVAKQAHPDVIILDIALPKMDGYQLVREFRERYKDVERPPLFIALSGYGQEDDKRRSLEAGFDHHVVKPIDIAQLRQLLNG